MGVPAEHTQADSRSPGVVEDFIRLRNQLHGGDFRFDVGPEAWEWYYTGRPGVEQDDVVSVYKDHELKGYAVACLSDFEADRKVYLVLELCAADQSTANELIDRVVAKGNQKNADFVLFRGCEGPFDRLLDGHGFTDMNESALIAMLINVRPLLTPLCREGVEGKTVRLEIRGDEPVGLVVGKDGLGLSKRDDRPSLSVTLDGSVFLSLLFGRASMWGEFIRGHIRIKGMLHILTAARLFRLIRQDKWYIPSGDWA